MLLLPFIYDIVIRASVDASSYGFKHRLHIGLNVFINIVCLVSLLRTNGDLRRRFEAAIICVFINYALLLFVLLSFRLYYSRPVLIVSFLASITLVALFNLLLEKYRERRVGIIPQGIDDDARWNVGSDADFIQSPTEPARNYDIILVDWAQITDPRWMRFATHAILSGCEVRHIASFMEIKHGRVLAEYFETDHAVSPAGSMYINWYKRILDILIVLLALPIALVVLATASLLILLTMGRPILFMQSRVGVDGRQFKMYKLRSMRSTSRKDGASATSIGDQRITPLGRFLRRFRIDEIPQFYNILIGDMSLVGPRPEQPELAQTYATKLPAFQNRTMLRPGITGWAQVRGRYAADEKETENKLAYDLYYLKYASFTMDVSIIAQTFKTLVTGNSAR
ncbi:MAG: sugar transferase [Hyphomicrobiaceae bacterium]